jgi:hypothetical protein
MGRSALCLQDLVVSGRRIRPTQRRFLAAEFLTEKLFRLLGATKPYATAVKWRRSIPRVICGGFARHPVDRPAEGDHHGRAVKLKALQRRHAKTRRNCSAAGVPEVSGKGSPRVAR